MKNFSQPFGHRLLVWLLPALFVMPGLYAQYSGGYGGRGGFNGGTSRAYTIRDPDELVEIQKMTKALNPAFIKDVFSVTRLIYTPNGYGRGARFWDDDTPDSDLNLGFRLFEATSLKIHPGYNYIHITPEELAKNPFVYLAATNGLSFSEEELQALRAYLLKGGFMMAEDFWGDRSWSFVYSQFKRLFPDREPVELNLSHPIFHTVFDFKYLAQMPSVGVWTGYHQAYDPSDYSTDHDPHYYAIFDDKNRIMVIICRNNHYGDGWEHEGDDHSYFDVFSMPQAYPMFINILFYAMTH